jgi:hypothetical protein
MAGEWIVLESRVVGCAAEIVVNDIPMAQIGIGMARSIARPVNEFLVSGANELRLTVNPGSTPSAARTPGPEPRRAPGATAIATLARYAEGAVSGDGSGEVLATVSWTGRADGEPEAFPQDAVAWLDLPEGVGPWRFTSAEPLELDEATVAAVADVIELLRGGLAAGDPQPYFELGARSLQETARAYGQSADLGVETLRAVVAESRNAPHWQFPPVPRDRWDLRLVAGGRMVECIATDWEPILRSVTDDDGNAFDIPLYLGRVGGHLVILR